MKKIVLAYSGGLDTSVALKWLQEQTGAEIIAFCANLGQFEDLEKIAAKARATGATKVVVEDLRSEFLQNYCFKALQASAAYEGKYLLAAPLGRPLIAKYLVDIAHRENAEAVAHGATGKGNDQVRFYSSLVALDSSLEIIAPVTEWEMKSRDEEIAYARKHKIPLPNITEENPYSIDTNLWGSSIECGPLDDLGLTPSQDVYQLTVDPEKAPEKPEVIDVGFDAGIPAYVNGQLMDPVSLVELLNKIGGRHGVGRIDILENRVVGIKTRGIYESPAGTILHIARQELENLVLDRDTLHFKARIAQTYAELVYYGLWFSPLRDALDGFIDRTRRSVNGVIGVRLHKGRITIESRQSEAAMYDVSLSTYGQGDEFDHSSGRGFAYVWSMPMRIARIAQQRMSGVESSKGTEQLKNRPDNK